MEIKGLLRLFFIFLVLSVVHSSEDGLKDSDLAAINRSNFPAGFSFSYLFPLILFYSMKVLQMKMVKEQAYGKPSLKNSLVSSSFCLFL
ncbi:hypothetical protein POTOM_005317 [Populus tomentosa]|uniref:Uncharacterized protein n=1 Tax=Populus tomentosa TaxID=118781 RepID=A0A8X8AMA3_POPTO|nr:hypothetical protein POTOM_005317 [Populus tomentosa]